jgi:transposase-like protein
MSAPDRITLSNCRKSRLSRPRALSDSNRKIIVDFLTAGESIQSACTAAGITPACLNHWRRRWKSGDPKAAEFDDFFCTVDSLRLQLQGGAAGIKKPEIWRRIRQSISSQIVQHLARHRSKKTSSTKSILCEILGYTSDDLIAHLENQFEVGMSWENYGQWHVDHKIPVSWFYFESVNDVQFRQCWALTNLQPKWARDNLVKSNRFAETEALPGGL